MIEKKKITIHGGLLKVKGLSQKGMASLSSVSNGKISVFVCICVLKINAYRLNFRWIQRRFCASNSSLYLYIISPALPK